MSMAAMHAGGAAAAEAAAMAAGKVSNCPHVLSVGCNTWDDVYRKKQTVDKCDKCGAYGPNLWLCLHSGCLFVGCGESASDHSTDHSEVRGQIKSEKHSLTLNMTTMRIWCYECETEVYRDNNNPPLLMRERSLSLTPLAEPAVSPSRSRPASPRNISPDNSIIESDSEDDELGTGAEKYSKPRGLTGLQNIGNTCYMNAALQALSNCPPLTRFFLDCPGYVNSTLASLGTSQRPMLSRSYMKLMQEMWNKKRRSYLVPSTVAQGIKTIHPMFRGYTQQDTQEFLRCFMDQLHEELKCPFPDSTTPHSKEEMLSLMDTEERTRSSSTTCIIPESSSSSSSAASSSAASSSNEDTSSQAASEATLVNEGGAKVRIEDERVRDDVGKDDDVGGEEMVASSSEYETCESGLSSERNSVEQNLNLNGTWEESSRASSGTTGSKGVKTKGKELPRTDKNKMRSPEGSDSGISITSTLSMVEQTNNKNLKDNVNKQHKQQAHEVHIMPVAEKLAEACLTDSSENVHETDPLQGQGQGHNKSKRSRSSSQRVSESEGKTVQQKASPQNVSSPSSQKAPTSPPPPTAGRKRKPLQYRSVISDIFDGKILSSVQCLTCERVSSTKETFQDLSLPIPSKDHLHMIHHAGPPPPSSSSNAPTPGSHKPTCGEGALKQGWMSWMYDWMKSWFWGPKITLNDCLAAFFSQDELKGDNMYSCEKCKKLRNGVKFSKVLELPEIICIHLKRFRHEFMFSSKISSFVEFPMDGLDMRPYLHKDCSDMVTTYDLTGVICHHGTAGGGHYTAFALNYSNERWYEFDDQYVTEVDMQQVENCEAYVLFYRKKNEHMCPHRLQAKQIFDSPDYSDSFMKFYISRQWINRFNTFAEPGPISNRDFLCRHGGVHPHRWPMVDELAENVPQKLWTHLHEKFGGGPAVNHLYPCDTCQVEMDRLKRRQRHEMETFVELHDMFKNEENPAAIYAISMMWFKEWENFVKARTDDPPGPIENQKIGQMKNGVPCIRHNSDYGQLSENMWRFLYNIYGGGPELALKSSPNQLEAGGGDAESAKA